MREQQEKLEREIADVRVRNSNLVRLVNMSNVQAVERANKERKDAFNMVAEEKQKANIARKNAKDEVVKVNRKAKEKVVAAKNQIRFWKAIAVGTFIVGLLIGFQL